MSIDVRVQVPSLAPPSFNNRICGCGGMADALASGASVRKDVGVQVPPSAPRIVLKSLYFSTFSFSLLFQFLTDDTLTTKGIFYSGVPCPRKRLGQPPLHWKIFCRYAIMIAKDWRRYENLQIRYLYYLRNNLDFLLHRIRTQFLFHGFQSVLVQSSARYIWQQLINFANIYYRI